VRRDARLFIKPLECAARFFKPSPADDEGYDIVAKSRIMYIEDKSGGLVGPARIGRVTFSKRGKTLHYQALSFQSLAGRGSKANFYCIETSARYWISGPRKDGQDGLYGYRPTPIDEDVREEYWNLIRQAPARVHESTT
jgi:hypothetical protein